MKQIKVSYWFLILLLNGGESDARYFSQSQSVAMQSQSNRGITFDAQVNTALSRAIMSIIFLVADCAGRHINSKRDRFSTVRTVSQVEIIWIRPIIELESRHVVAGP